MCEEEKGSIRYVMEAPSQKGDKQRDEVSPLPRTHEVKHDKNSRRSRRVASQREILANRNRSRKLMNKLAHALVGNTSWLFPKSQKAPIDEEPVVVKQVGFSGWANPSGSALAGPGNTPSTLNWFVGYFDNTLSDDGIYYDIDVQLRVSIANMDHIDPNLQGQFTFSFGIGSVVDDPMQGYSVTEEMWSSRFQNGKSNVSWGDGSLSWGSFKSDFTIKVVKLSDAGIPKPIAFWATVPNTWYQQGSSVPLIGFSWTAFPVYSGRHVVVDGGSVNISGGSVSVSGTVSVSGNVDTTLTAVDSLVRIPMSAKADDGQGVLVTVDIIAKQVAGEPGAHQLMVYSSDNPANLSTVNARLQGINGGTWYAVKAESVGSDYVLGSYVRNPADDQIPCDIRGWHTGLIDPSSSLPIVGGVGGFPLITSVTTVGNVLAVDAVGTVGAVGVVNHVNSILGTVDVQVKGVDGRVPVDSENYVWDASATPPAWVKEGESGVVNTVNSQNYVWDQTLQPPAWVREGESGNVPTSNVNVQSIAAQSAPFWMSTVRPGVPAIVQSSMSQSDIGMLGAGSSKGDGPTMRGSMPTDEYVRALALMGLRPSCVPDFTSPEFYNRFKLAVATQRLRSEFRGVGVPPPREDVPAVDIGLIGAGASKGDGPSVGKRLSPRRVEVINLDTDDLIDPRVAESKVIPTIPCENSYAILANPDFEGMIVSAANSDMSSLEDSGHHVLSSYAGHLVLGRSMPNSRVKAYPAKKERESSSSESGSGSSSEEEGGRRKSPKTKEQQEKDQAGALERISSAITSPAELLSWLYTHRAVSPKWRRQIIDSATSSNPEWDGDVCLLLIDALIANGDSKKTPEACFRAMIEALLSARHSQFQSLKRACQCIPLSELYAAFERIEGEFVPAARLVCIEPNPGPAWIRDLTEEGVEPNPGPMDVMPDTMEGVRALPSYENVIESASGMSPDSGEPFDPVTMIANIAGQYGLGNAATHNTSYQMGMRNQAVLADNTFLQNAFSFHAECFTHPMDVADPAHAGQMMNNPNAPEVFGASLMAYKVTRPEVITPQGEDLMVMVLKQAAIRDNHITIRGKYVRDTSQHLVGPESTFGTDLNVPLTKLALYGSIFSTAQPSSQCPWGNELAATDSGLIFAGDDNPVPLAWSNPAAGNIAGAGCTDAAGLNILPFSDNAVRGRIFFHITDATVPTGATKIEMQNDLMLYAWNGNPAVVYGLYACAWGKFPQGIAQLSVPAFYAGGTVPTVSHRIPYANLNEIDGLDDIHLVTTVDVASKPATDQVSANAAAYVRPTWGAASGNEQADAPLNVNFDAANLVSYDLTSFCVGWLRRLAEGANGMDTLHRFSVAYARAFSVCSTLDNIWRDAAFMSVRYPRLLISNHQGGSDLMFPVNGGTTTSNPAGHLGQPMAAAFGAAPVTAQHYAFSLPNPYWHNRIAMGMYSPVGKPLDTVYEARNYYNTRRHVQYQMMWARVCAIGANAVMSYHGLPYGIWNSVFGEGQFRDQIAELRRYYVGGSGGAYNQAPELGHVPACAAVAITGCSFTTDDLGRTIFERLFAPVYGVNSPVRLVNNVNYVPARNCVPVFLPDLHMAQYSGKLTIEVAPYLSLNKKGCGIMGPNFRTMVFPGGQSSMPIDPEDSFTMMGIDSVVNANGKDNWNSGLVMALFNGTYATYAGTAIDPQTYVGSGEYASLPTRPRDFSWGEGTVVAPASVLIGTRRTIPVVNEDGLRILLLVPQGSKQQMYQVLSGAAFTALPAWSIRNIVPNPSLLMSSEAPRASKLKARTLALNGGAVHPNPDSGGGMGQSSDI